MARRRSLLFNSAVYVVGQFITKALGFVLLLVYARFLQPEDFGITGTLSAYGQILSTVFLLGLHGAVSKHYFDLKDDPRELKSYLSSVFLFQLVLSGVVVALLDQVGETAWARYTSASIPFHPYVRLMLWTTFVGTLTTIPQTIYQTQERAGVIVGFQLFQGVAAVAVGIVFVAVLRQHALGVLRSQVVSNGLLALVFTALFARYFLSLDLRWRHVRRALQFGLPLMPHTIGSILMQTVDRMMLEKYVALDEVGQYSIAMTLGMILIMVAGGVNQAWAPHFLRTMRDEPEATARGKAQQFAALFIALFAVLAIIGGLFAHELVHLVLGAKYVPAVPYLAPFLIGNLIAVYYYLPANQLFLLEKTTWFLVATSLATAVSVGLNLWFLPRGGGATAAAWIFVAGNVVQTGIILLAALKLERFRLLRWQHGAIFVATTGALAATHWPLGWPIRAAMALVVIALAWQFLVRGNLGGVIPPRPR